MFIFTLDLVTHMYPIITSVETLGSSGLACLEKYLGKGSMLFTVSWCPSVVRTHVSPLSVTPNGPVVPWELPAIYLV